MPDFLQNYGAGIGLGVGLLPQLLQNLFGSSGGGAGGNYGGGGDAGAGTVTPPTGLTPAMTAGSFQAPNNSTGYAGGGPGGITNANVQNFPAGGGSTSPLGGLQGMMNALNPKIGTMQSPGNGIQVIQPTPVPAQNFGASGPNMQMIQGLQSLMGGAAGAQGAGPPAMGPAAANPLLAMFRPRI